MYQPVDAVSLLVVVDASPSIRCTLVFSREIGRSGYVTGTPECRLRSPSLLSADEKIGHYLFTRILHWAAWGY
jgi:hypothetical protein